MRALHTPGRWLAWPGLYCWNVAAANGPRTFNVAKINTDRAEQEANAHLIAAAPELLEACEALAHWDECWPSAALEGALRKARAAIAKAKGEA